MKNVIFTFFILLSVLVSIKSDTIVYNTNGEDEDKSYLFTPSPLEFTLLCTVNSERVFAELTVSNTSDHVFCAENEHVLLSHAINPPPINVIKQGKRVRWLKPIGCPAGALTTNDFYCMKPHEILLERFELSYWYDTSQPGEYAAYYHAGDIPIGDTHLYIGTSAPVTFKIGK